MNNQNTNKECSQEYQNMMQCINKKEQCEVYFLDECRPGFCDVMDYTTDPEHCCKYYISEFKKCESKFNKENIFLNRYR